MLIRRITRIAFPLLAITAGALFLSACHGRHACGWGGSPEKRAEHITKRISKELDLTAEQKTKLEKIKTDILARKSEFTNIHGGLKEMFLGQIRSPSVDKDKLNQGFEEREAKVKELRTFLISEFAEFHGMLDASQKEKLASKMQGYCR
jgi:Spy/CpxP family protein refolding chaperone